jgi:tRNA(adenine34) deaminase
MNETDGQKNIYIQTQCVESPDAESGNMQSIDTGMSDEVNEDVYTQDDIKYMKEAIRQAKKAWKLTEVPIGCVIVYNDKIIGRGYNRRNTDKTTLGHAEITAIKRASKIMGDWRLEDCTLYVTLEPCQMCAGAIVQARIPRVVIGSMNPKAGCAGSILNLLDMQQFNHRCEVVRGVMKQECSDMLTTFFKELREIKKREKQQNKE